MKVKFSKKVTYIPTWNENSTLPVNEQVSVELCPMVTGDVMVLLDVFQSMADSEMVDGKLVLTSSNAQSIKKLVESAGEFVPKYAKIFNLTDQDGSEITAEEIIKYPYYMELASEILGELAVISMPSEEEAKNSVTQPGLPPSLHQ